MGFNSGFKGLSIWNSEKVIIVSNDYLNFFPTLCMYDTIKHFVNRLFPSSGVVFIHQKKETDVFPKLCAVLYRYLIL